MRNTRPSTDAVRHTLASLAVKPTLSQLLALDPQRRRKLLISQRCAANTQNTPRQLISSFPCGRDGARGGAPVNGGRYKGQVSCATTPAGTPSRSALPALLPPRRRRRAQRVGDGAPVPGPVVAPRHWVLLITEVPPAKAVRLRLLARAHSSRLRPGQQHQLRDILRRVARLEPRVAVGVQVRLQRHALCPLVGAGAGLIPAGFRPRARMSARARRAGCRLRRTALGSAGRLGAG